MRHIIRKSFFGLGPAPAVAPTAPVNPTKIGGRSKNPNLYAELTPFESQPTAPYNDGNDVFDTLIDDYYASPWLTEPNKQTLRDNWDMVVNEDYGSILMKTISAGTQGFFYKGDGVYEPNQANAGNVVNTVDWSDKYDAMRCFYWLYWTDAGSSCGIIHGGIQRPTAGTSNFGGVSIEHMRSFNYTPSIAWADGDGNSGRVYMGTQTQTNSDTTCVQIEFIKGSHCKIEMYYNNPGVTNFALCSDPPNWNFDTPANCATLDMSVSGLNQMVPVNPSFFAQLSSAGTPGRFGKWCWECRPIGGKWKYLK